MKVFGFIALFIISPFMVLNGWSQTFGQNKPHYSKFDFSVYQTSHFDIYSYLENPDFLNDLIENTECWYAMHKAIFKDSFDTRNPIILYNTHAEFQQTETISVRIGEGTGGVTESLKNRVIFPVLFSNQQTGHVLGHELVHAFQYHFILNFNTREEERRKKAIRDLFSSKKKKKKKDEGKEEENKDTDQIRRLSRDTASVLIDIRNLPLWMIEGMAEYLSIGRNDPHTAMWMRDAFSSNRFPSIEDLNNFQDYFPYRWGQAFWAYVVGTFGVESMMPLFIETGQYGLDVALIRRFGMDAEAFGNVWKKDFESYYESLEPRDSLITGHVLLSGKGGLINVGPSISPNGKYMVFISEKDLFSLDLFLAETSTGTILKKLTTTSRAGHLDAVASTETSVTWSPDSRQIAFIGFKRGQNVLVIQDVFSKRDYREFELGAVKAITTPSWSPDGKYILVSGLVDGYVDLFVLDVKTGEVHQVTNDRYSEILANWSPSGDKIIYSTDRYALEEGQNPGSLYYHLEMLKIADKSIERLPFYKGGDQLNPIFDPSGNGIWFLSNHDGFRDLYYYDLALDSAYRKTNFWTGVSGITPFAPAFSISNDSIIVYSLYSENKYQVFQVQTEDLVGSNQFDSLNKAGYLPPYVSDPISNAVKTIGLEQPDSIVQQYKKVGYRPKFKLDFISGEAGIGVTTSSLGTATGLNGGINTFFSDILGYQQLFAGMALNGEIQDLAIQSAFINQKGRLPWGIGISHIPYRSGSIEYAGLTPFYPEGDTLLTDHYIMNIYRVFEEQISGAVYFPLNVFNRFELSGAVSYYHTKLIKYHMYYFGPFLFDRKKEKITGLDNFFISDLTAAFVHDNSVFGFTSPSTGFRYRIELGQYFGDFHFNTLLFDFRKYWFLNPSTIAVRTMHYGRYGEQNQLNPLYIGYPGLVRGYSINRVIDSFWQNYNYKLNQLVGNKIALFSLEYRLPFTGNKRLALTPSRFWYSDIAFFFDSGVTYNNYRNLWNDPPEDSENSEYTENPLLVGSVGLSYRVNLGGIILEPYYAIPLNKGFPPGLGFNILPGW